MLNAALGILALVTQLTAVGGGLPQVLNPDYKATTPIKTGGKGEVTVSFRLLNGYAINRTPPIQLKLNAVAGVTLEKTDFTTPSEDPKSKDEYYVDLPTLKVTVIAAKSGKYEIPGKLVYFFCNKADGFCARQVLDVKVPIQVQ